MLKFSISSSRLQIEFGPSAKEPNHLIRRKKFFVWKLYISSLIFGRKLWINTKTQSCWTWTITIQPKKLLSTSVCSWSCLPACNRCSSSIIQLSRFPFIKYANFFFCPCQFKKWKQITWEQVVVSYISLKDDSSPENLVKYCVKLDVLDLKLWYIYYCLNDASQPASQQNSILLNYYPPFVPGLTLSFVNRFINEVI